MNNLSITAHIIDHANWIAIHENAAREYDKMALEATNPDTADGYRKLAANRRERAEWERQKKSEHEQAIASAQSNAKGIPL